MLKPMQTTKSSTGLKVKAHFVRRHYKTGEKVSDFQMDFLSIKLHESFPSWNHTLNPRTKCEIIFEWVLRIDLDVPGLEAHPKHVVPQIAELYISEVHKFSVHLCRGEALREVGCS